MRRLTLILSDLYLPEEAERGAIPAALALPNLDWLLRFANRAERIRDWRTWLSADLGAERLSKLPVAQCCALGLLPPAAASNAWLATPVHLEARLDHVRLVDRGLLRILAEERGAWQAEFARAFGPEHALHEAGERGFLLSGLAGASVDTVDPARLLDADVGVALPSGPAASDVRRLGTEIEMWLHGAAVNAVRERARQRRVSALWLWGGGPTEIAPTPAASVAQSQMLLVYGGDPYLLALARMAERLNCTVPMPVKAAPSAYAALDDSAIRFVVELSPMSGTTDESLATLDANWFGPMREALNSGALEQVDLIANDRWFRILARPAWRIWRRRLPWLAQLARKA
jgi:hypothetical protein